MIVFLPITSYWDTVGYSQLLAQASCKNTNSQPHVKKTVDLIGQTYECLQWISFQGDQQWKIPTVLYATNCYHHGCDGIKKASEASGIIIIGILPGQQVHQECRKIHCNPKCIDAYKRKRASDSCAPTIVKL